MTFILKILVLILYYVHTDCVKFRCDYRYTNIGWFKYHEIPATWDDALLRCHLEGGTLASPLTTEMKSHILELFCKPKILTGIHATYSKGNYYSIDGTSLEDIPHEWSRFEPDNKNNAENCLALHSDGKLSDVRCDEPLPYVCYQSHSNVDVNVCGTPDPEYHFESQTNKCYKFHTRATTWVRAHFICSAEGSHLAIINSDEESKVIAQIFAKYPKANIFGSMYQDIALIGFKYWDNHSQWTTIHGQSLQEAGFAKFSPGQPDNFKNREYCGTIFRTGFLNDGDCDVNYAFFCEKKIDSPAVCDSVIARNYTRVCDNDIDQGQQSQSCSESRNGDNPEPIF